MLITQGTGFFLKPGVVHVMAVPASTVSRNAIFPFKKQTKKQNKYETELTASVLKKKSQNTQEIKITLFNWTKWDKTCKISRKSSLSSYIHKNRRKKPKSIQLTLLS